MMIERAAAKDDVVDAREMHGRCTSSVRHRIHIKKNEWLDSPAPRASFGGLLSCGALGKPLASAQHPLEHPLEPPPVTVRSPHRAGVETPFSCISSNASSNASSTAAGCD